MAENDIAELRARADAGDREAMTALGKRLLGNVEGPADIRDGAAYVARAAALDDAEALAMQTTLVAAGMQNEPSWERAMALLQRSAERRSRICGCWRARRATISRRCARAPISRPGGAGGRRPW